MKQSSYYTALSAFFAAMLFGFFTTIEESQPRRQDMDSLIKGNPGMGFRPMITVEKTLIKFKQGQKDSYSKYVDDIESFLADQEMPADNAVDCSDGKPSNMQDHEFCQFDLESIKTDCNEANDYGYHEGNPCVLLKLNKIYNWSPELYDNSTRPPHLEDQFDPEHLTMTCDGENPADRDNLGDGTKYAPPHGFAMVSFPYLNQKGYQTPLIFARLDSLKSGVTVQVSCKVWARNVYHHKTDRAGAAHFEILMD
jgi:sodium/potassium-transporting ATPase subunit beta